MKERNQIPKVETKMITTMHMSILLVMTEKDKLKNMRK